MLLVRSGRAGSTIGHATLSVKQMAIAQDDCDFDPRAVSSPIGDSRRMLPLQVKVTIMSGSAAFDGLLFVPQGAWQLLRAHSSDRLRNPVRIRGGVESILIRASPECSLVTLEDNRLYESS